eukprot:CAMPEP_0181110904 /NCGR_PEP_ID=MMETSP1071-20121207/18971_1 /TAXON_ID=35127 /ORGANISM="Thalassiosira sp., Strain NH16" /LENGTH=216 /DNA_ID=CAMNT_0023194723 /DNA_START=92 /DNA_END=740 /DNA_ORIENTATION=+
MHRLNSIAPLLLALLLLLPTPASSQRNVPITDPSSQCIAAPCPYMGECRDRSGSCCAECCNADSQWLPGCGGGGTMSRPQQQQQGWQQQQQGGQQQQPMQQQQYVPAPQPPANSPAMMKESTTPPTTASMDQPERGPSDGGGEGTIEDENFKNEGGKEYAWHAGNEDYSGPQSNLTAGWFDGNKWGDRPPEEEEKGMVDKAIDTIDFWNNRDESGA